MDFSFSSFKEYKRRIIDEMVEQARSGRSYLAIAEQYGVTDKLVRYYAMKAGLPARGKGAPGRPRRKRQPKVQ